MEESIGNTVVETEHFIKVATALWSQAELDGFKGFIAVAPMTGDEIPGTGGLRKVRYFI